MYDRILVPMDGSKLAECVLPYVEKLAQGCSAKEVTLLRVCEPFSVLADYPASMPHSWEEHASNMTVYAQQQCSLYLTDVEKRLKDLGLNVRTESRLGDPAKEIVDYVSNNEVDLIVMASHGRSGISRWAFGSVADRVFRSICVPIMMIRPPGCVPGI